MRLLLAAALAAALASPAAADPPTKREVIASSILIIAAANSCPAGTVPDDIIPVVIFTYAEAMGMPLNDATARRLDLMGNIVALRVRQEGRHDEMCEDAKKAMLGTIKS